MLHGFNNSSQPGLPKGSHIAGQDNFVDIEDADQARDGQSHIACRFRNYFERPWVAEGISMFNFIQRNLGRCIEPEVTGRLLSQGAVAPNDGLGAGDGLQAAAVPAAARQPAFGHHNHMADFTCSTAIPLKEATIDHDA